MLRLADFAKNTTPLTEVTSLDLSQRNAHQIEDLSVCVCLRKLKLDGNNLESLECVAHCYDLTWLSCVGNRISGLGKLKRLKKLTVSDM
jgi:Leucine-rich repeat (LRR) protein